MAEAQQIVPDTEHRGLVGLLPAGWRPYALLARFDRPIGWWLLFWPGAWAVALSGGAVRQWGLILWLLLGSIAMRGAGCVYNDIVDRDLDRQVARTRSRPVASGAVSVKAAAAWLAALCLVGLLVWLQLHWPARLVALASIAPVAAYPGSPGGPRPGSASSFPGRRWSAGSRSAASRWRRSRCSMPAASPG